MELALFSYMFYYAGQGTDFSSSGELTFVHSNYFYYYTPACTGRNQMKRRLNTRYTIEECIDDGFIRRTLSLLSCYNNDQITSDPNNHPQSTSKHSNSTITPGIWKRIDIPASRQEMTVQDLPIHAVFPTELEGGQIGPQKGLKEACMQTPSS